MPPSDPTPDLDESINVTEAHERVVREAAAAAREKRIAENGREPVSLWLIVVCGLAAMIAGAVLGDAGKLFSYASTFRPGYVRAVPEGAGDSGPAPRPALAAFSSRGSRIYAAKCQACHGPDGRGGPSYPSLVGSEWVKGNTQTLAMVILNGLAGPTSTGKDYGAVMPGQGGGMSNEDLAGIMTYIRNNLGNEVGDVVTVEMAAAAFDISGKRATPGASITADEIKSTHGTMLSGEPLDPETLVNPVDLKPVESGS